VTLPSAGGVLRITVACLLTAIVLWSASPGAVLEAARGADARWILAAVALVVVDRALMAYRWIVLLEPLGPGRRPPLGRVLRIFFISTFAGTFLPGSVGGDAVRAYSLSRLNVPPGIAVASVLMDRVLGVLSIVIVGAAGLMLAGRSDLLSERATLIPLVAAAGGCVLAAAVVFTESAASIAQRAAASLPAPRLRAIAEDLAQATRAYARYHGALANVLAGSLAVQVLRILQAWALGRAIGIESGPAVYFAFVPLILLVMLLPITVNGIGTSQAAFVWFFTRANVTEADAFVLSVLFLALGVIGNLPGGVLYAFRPKQAPLL
jgi:uncharacterized protein (TIRG00374 family)